MLTMTDIERNAKLAPILWGFLPTGFAARRLLPVVPHSNTSGQYASFDGSHLRYIKSRGEGRTKAASVSVGLSYTSFSTIDHFKDIFIPDRQSQEMGDDVAIPFMEMLTTNLLIEEEYDIAAAALATSNYTVSNHTAPGATFNSASADPKNEFIKGRKCISAYAGGDMMNIGLLVDPETDFHLRDFVMASHSLSQYSGEPTEEDMKRFFSLTDYIVASASYNAAVEGQTDDFDPIWTRGTALLFYKAPNPSLLAPSFGYTIVNTKGSKVDVDVLKNPAGDNLLAHADYLQKVISYQVAYLLHDCLT